MSFSFIRADKYFTFLPITKCYSTNRVFKRAGPIQLFLHCSREPGGDVVPISDLNRPNVKIEMIFSFAYLENSFDVVRSDILVLEVVGVLPHVDTEQRDEAGSGLQGVLRMFYINLSIWV